MAVDSNSSIYQRIRYGLTGLAVVFLVVLLGAALRRMGEDGPPPAPTTVASDPNEPLAEIGAAPGQVGDDNEAAPAAAPSVKRPARK